MKSEAILNAWRLVIKTMYIPKSLRGKVELKVTNEGVELTNIKMQENK